MLFIIPLLFIKPISPAPNALPSPLNSFPSLVLSMCFLYNTKFTSQGKARGGRFFRGFILGPCKPSVILPSSWCLNIPPRSWHHSWESYWDFMNLNTESSYLSPKAAIWKHNLNPTQALKSFWWCRFQSSAAFLRLCPFFPLLALCLMLSDNRIEGLRGWEMAQTSSLDHKLLLRHYSWNLKATLSFYCADISIFRKRRYLLAQNKSKQGG